MRRLLVFLFCTFVLSGSSGLLCQNRMLPNESGRSLDSSPGFISINELTAGIGLGLATVPYSESFFGFTTVNGYQTNENFIAGVGTGLYFYKGGLLVPLFLDLRYRINIGRIYPYVFTDGGMLLNFSDITATKPFINPGIGIKYSFSHKIAVNLGGGLMVQWGDLGRDAFINIKSGITYKF